jgi:Ca2+-binding RTX toxin-like protein
MPTRHRLTAPRLVALEDRSVPALIVAGFNDAEGLNANPTPDSPYKIGDQLVGYGSGEAGWANTWSHGVGDPWRARVQGDVVYEGDGAVALLAYTTAISRTWSPAQTAGIVHVSQWFYFPPNGGVGQYITGDGATTAEATAAQWDATPSGTFRIVDSGLWDDTGIPVPVNRWVEVYIEIDIAAQTYEFWADGQHYTPSDPTGFRGDPTAIFGIVNLLEHPVGFYWDAVKISDAPFNDRPIARDDTFAVPFASPMQVPAPGVLGNDSDPDGDPVTVSLLSQPAIGSVTLNPDGSFAYAFPVDFVGTTSFSYKASDAGGDGNTATVTLTREGLVNVTGGAATIIASGGTDSVRLRPAGKGVKLEMSLSGVVTRQTVLPAFGASKLTSVDVYLGPGSDHLDAGSLTIPVRAVGGAGDDLLRTGKKGDTVFGGEADGTGTGRDVIASGGGNDTVTGGAGGGDIDAGAGNDLVTVLGGWNWVEGGAGNDVLLGGTGADALFGGAGKDLVAGGTGADLLEGGGGTDILFDGSVAVTDPATNSLAKVLAAFVPAKRPTLVAISGQLAVTPDGGAADTLTGGGGTDWFWSADLVDVLDLLGSEPKNAIV